MSFRPVSSLYKLEFLISKIENIGLVYSARAFNVISALFCVKGCVETVTKSPRLYFGSTVLRSFAFILLILKQKQEELREKRFGSRINKTFTLDFAGRKVQDEQENLSYQKYAQEIENILQNEKDNSGYFSTSIANQEETLFNPTVCSEKLCFDCFFVPNGICVIFLFFKINQVYRKRKRKHV